MRVFRGISVAVSLLLTGAIFGFFYAWICSTMWGLDAADPRVAIQAMQAMNASVRNGVFAPAFFGTPFALFLSSALFFKNKKSTLLFFLAGLIYVLGGMVLTLAVNVPMNEALALVDVPNDVDAAAQIWQDYSSKWQVYNIARTVFSGIALLMTGAGIYFLGRASVE